MIVIVVDYLGQAVFALEFIAIRFIVELHTKGQSLAHNETAGLKPSRQSQMFGTARNGETACEYRLCTQMWEVTPKGGTMSRAVEKAP